MGGELGRPAATGERVGDAAVPADPVGPGQLGVRGPADEVVREAQGGRGERVVDQDAGRDGLGEQRVGVVRQGARERRVDLLAGDRAGADQLAAGRAELAHPLHDQAAQLDRQVELGGRLREPAVAAEEAGELADVRAGCRR